MSNLARHRMIRVIASGFAAIWLGLAAHAQGSPRDDFARALGLARAGNWTALAQASPLEDPVARDVIDWHRLRAQKGSFEECEDFTARNPDWPGMPLLHRRCEGTIPWDASADRVQRFFESRLPSTGLGAYRLAEALTVQQSDDEAKALIRKAWAEFALNPSEHRLFLGTYGEALGDLHTVRLDMVLWRGDRAAAERMYDLVSDDWKQLAELRLALREGAGNVDTLIEALPPDMAEDSGLAHERFMWRLRKGRIEGATELLLDRSISRLDLGRPEIWAQRRHYLARETMAAGNYSLAYEIASTHFMEDTSELSDLEWLAGYLALRHLGAPAQAASHFETLQAVVRTPISLGRAGYWLGRAREALGDEEGAQAAFVQGARYQSSFYGQLAAEKAGLPAPEAMMGQEEFPDWRKAPFIGSKVLEAAMQLYIVGSYDLSERFLLHLAESQSREGVGQLGRLAFELKNPHIALMIAKQGAKAGHEVWESYFPVTTPAGLDLPIAEEIALAIARRESEFNPVVASSAGARGLMQLMPATAREVAGRIGEPYVAGRLLTDPDYNARIGGAYLAELSRTYDGNLVLMSAAYNAGPSRVAIWVRENGDPRSPQVDAVDWIESIPYRETRNYVMRVTESIAPYRARLTGEVAAPALSDLLTR